MVCPVYSPNYHPHRCHSAMKVIEPCPGESSAGIKARPFGVVSSPILWLTDFPLPSLALHLSSYNSLNSLLVSFKYWRPFKLILISIFSLKPLICLLCVCQPAVWRILLQFPMLPPIGSYPWQTMRLVIYGVFSWCAFGKSRGVPSSNSLPVERV